MLGVPPLYLGIGGLVAVLAAGAAGYHYGVKHARNACEAAKAREERVALVATNASIAAATEAIKAIEVRHTTIRQRLEKEIRYAPSNPGCDLSPATVSLLNDALAGNTPAAEASDRRAVPEAGSPTAAERGTGRPGPPP